MLQHGILHFTMSKRILQTLINSFAHKFSSHNNVTSICISVRGLIITVLRDCYREIIITNVIRIISECNAGGNKILLKHA